MSECFRATEEAASRGQDEDAQREAGVSRTRNMADGLTSALRRKKTESQSGLAGCGVSTQRKVPLQARRRLLPRAWPDRASALGSAASALCPVMCRRPRGRGVGSALFGEAGDRCVHGGELEARDDGW